MAGEALLLHIRGMLEDGEAVPEPSTIDNIAKDPALKNAVAFLVNANIEKTVRINITARESQIKRIDQLARRAGISRSAYKVQSSAECNYLNNTVNLVPKPN